MLTTDFGLSPIVHGQMRMAGWKLTRSELQSFLEELVDLGVTSFDHADIYGNYSCESLLGEILMENPGLRNRIEIITKCGILLKSDKFPDRKTKYYDYSFDHIIASVESSLKNFRTDHVELLLLHRPAPFFDPEPVAHAFRALKKEGKVLHFGVSNFTPSQFEMLNAYTDEKLVTNQVEISPLTLEHFDNGNIDFFLREKIRPMAWSPLGGGRILNPSDDKGSGVLMTLRAIAGEMQVRSVDQVIYTWLLKHPAGIIPVVGSGNLDRIKAACESLDLDMSLEQWYRIFAASRGKELP